MIVIREAPQADVLRGALCSPLSVRFAMTLQDDEMAASGHDRQNSFRLKADVRADISFWRSGPIATSTPLGLTSRGKE
jgi:hypothetical protein